MTQTTTLVPRRPPRSSISRALGLIAFPWAVGLLVGLDSLLTATGLPPSPDRPFAVRIVGLAVAWAPAVLWWFSPALGQLPGLGWLIERGPVSVSLSDGGISIHRGGASRQLIWSDVANIVVFEGWPPRAEIRLSTGERTTLPGEVVRGRTSDGRETSLLAEIARYRPAAAASRQQSQRAVSLVIGALLVIAAFVAVAILQMR